MSTGAIEWIVSAVNMCYIMDVVCILFRLKKYQKQPPFMMHYTTANDHHNEKYVVKLKALVSPTCAFLSLQIQHIRYIIDTTSVS